MINSLAGVLLRFRQCTISIGTDIEGMFHQIRVRGDQDSLRFLRWTNTYEDPPDVYVTCLTTHCVHFEVVNSMDTDDFVMSLRHFISLEAK